MDQQHTKQQNSIARVALKHKNTSFVVSIDIPTCVVLKSICLYCICRAYGRGFRHSCYMQLTSWYNCINRDVNMWKKMNKKTYQSSFTNYCHIWSRWNCNNPTVYIFQQWWYEAMIQLQAIISFIQPSGNSWPILFNILWPHEIFAVCRVCTRIQRIHTDTA